MCNHSADFYDARVNTVSNFSVNVQTSFPYLNFVYLKIRDIFFIGRDDVHTSFTRCFMNEESSIK